MVLNIETEEKILAGWGTAKVLIRPKFFYFLFYRFFSQQVRVGGRNKNKIHSDHFQITVFPSILIQLENGPNEFYFTN